MRDPSGCAGRCAGIVLTIFGCLGCEGTHKSHLLHNSAQDTYIIRWIGDRVLGIFVGWSPKKSGICSQPQAISEWGDLTVREMSEAALGCLRIVWRSRDTYTMIVLLREKNKKMFLVLTHPRVLTRRNLECVFASAGSLCCHGTRHV